MASPGVAVVLDGVGHHAVPPTKVLQRRVTAEIALAPVLPKGVVEAFAVASFCFAEVIRVRLNLKEADLRVQLPHAVLQRRAAERPLVGGGQRKHSLGCIAAAVLNRVGLVQDDAVPVEPMQNGFGKVRSCLLLLVLRQLFLLIRTFLQGFEVRLDPSQPPVLVVVLVTVFVVCPFRAFRASFRFAFPFGFWDFLHFFHLLLFLHFLFRLVFGRSLVFPI
mmetsp:Transcript_48301/g.92379  ORF Transcript_48301/g.92379 Transcript_48301/m.92379 type:complete len:220 (-) Transcript_48301:725-1384(-)